MSSSECKELLDREPLLLESLLELISRKILCWKSACCVRFLRVYPTCTCYRSELLMPAGRHVVMCNIAATCMMVFVHHAFAKYQPACTNWCKTSS